MNLIRLSFAALALAGLLLWCRHAWRKTLPRRGAASEPAAASAAARIGQTAEALQSALVDFAGRKRVPSYRRLYRWMQQGYRELGRARRMAQGVAAGRRAARRERAR